MLLLFEPFNLRINLNKKIRSAKTVNVEPVNKNFAEVNKQQKQGNLIPRDYIRVVSTMLGSQEKFDKVMEKVIAKLDELDRVVLVLHQRQQQ